MPEPTSIKELNVLFNEFRSGLEGRLSAIVKGLEDKFAATTKGLEDKFAATTEGLGDQFDSTIKGSEGKFTAIADGVKEKVGVLQTIGMAILGSIAVLIAGVGGNYYYIYQVKTEITAKLGEVVTAVAVLQNQMKESKEASDAFYKNALQRLGASDVRPPPVRPPPSPPIVTSLASDALLVREFVKTDPINKAAVPRIAIGDILPESALRALPSDLIARAPAFSGVRYAIDSATNLIALADTSGRVFALV